MKSRQGIFLFFLLLIGNISIFAQVVTFNVPGATHTYLTCVNDSNFMGGYYINSSGTHGFIYNGQTIITLNYPGAAQTYIFGLSNSKLAVGAYNTTGNVTGNEGFKYDMTTGNYTDLTSSWLANMDATAARDINTAGCLVGDYKQGTSHACFAMCNTAQVTFAYNYSITYINSINNFGKRVGYWIDGASRHGLVWNNGVWSQLDYPGYNKTMLTGINDSNTIVGVFNLNRSFIMSHGIYKEIKKAGAIDFQVRDVSNPGIAVGYYADGNGVYHGFWTPIWDLTFRPKPNGWRFANSRQNMFPPEWYNQFDYNHDPYLKGNSYFPKKPDQNGVLKVLAKNTFPDWPLFVDIVGEDQCYKEVNKVKVVKSKAFDRFSAIAGDFGGVCNGFVESAFMVWDSVQRFKAKFPKVGPWTANNTVYDLPLNIENRRCINHLFWMEYQKGRSTFANKSIQADAKTLLERVKQMFQGRSINLEGLTFENQHGPGAHILNPYRITVDTNFPRVQYIYVYDNNYPGDSTRRVKIDTSYNEWFYNMSENANVPSREWGGINCSYGMYLDWPIYNYYNPVPLDSVGKNSKTDPWFISGTLEILISKNCDFIAENDIGQKIKLQGDIVENNLPGAFALISKSGTPEPPYGYRMPAADYAVEMSVFKSTFSSLTLFTELADFRYYRGGADISQKDKFVIKQGSLCVINPDNISKTVNLACTHEFDTDEFNVEVSSINLAQGGNVELAAYQDTLFTLTNKGAMTMYHLALKYLGNDAESAYRHDSIVLPANTMQIIHAIWNNLKTASVCIYEDHGINGSIDDTLCFNNTIQPLIAAYPTQFRFSSSAQADSVFFINAAGGNMNWNVSSASPAWLNVSGTSSGSNDGKVVISVTANTAGARSGLISIASTTASNSPYAIAVDQDGVIAAPAGMTATDGTSASGVNLSWTASPGAGYYRVSRSDSAGFSGNAITGWISGLTYADISAMKGKLYYYQVMAAQSNTGLNATGFSNQDEGWRKCFTTDFATTGECAGQTVVFTNTSSVHTLPKYAWDVNNDGTAEYTSLNAEHTFATPGTYPVKLAITDSACTDSIIHNVVIKEFPAISLIGDSTACASQTVTLQAGAGFSAYLWSTGQTTAGITVDSSGSGLGLHAYSVRLTYGNGCSALATARIKWDTCAVAGNLTLAGTVTYDNILSTPLNDATVTLKQNGLIAKQATTDSQGHYSLNNITAGTYVLSGECSKAWGGVNSADALKVSRHFVGLITLTGVRLMAADVNASGAINAADALLVAKRFVGLSTSFAAGDWAFSKDTLSLNSSQTANVKAVVFGDVDGSYIPPAKMNCSAELMKKGILVAIPSGKADIPLSIAGSHVVGAISIVAELPGIVESIVDVKSEHPGTLVYNVNGRELRLAWYSLSPMVLSGGDKLLTLSCKLKSEASPQQDEWLLKAETQLADETGALIPDTRLFMPEIVLNNGNYYLSQNVPNPFSGSTEISWFMPLDGQVTLKVYDISGREIRTITKDNFSAGTHTISLDASDLNPGMYLYGIKIIDKAEGFNEMRSFLLIK